MPEEHQRGVSVSITTLACSATIQEAHEARQAYVRRTLEGVSVSITSQACSTSLQRAHEGRQVCQMNIRGVSVIITSRRPAEPLGDPPTTPKFAKSLGHGEGTPSMLCSPCRSLNVPDAARHILLSSLIENLLSTLCDSLWVSIRFKSTQRLSVRLDRVFLMGTHRRAC
jgi:hypothetical protein